MRQTGLLIHDIRCQQSKYDYSSFNQSSLEKIIISTSFTVASIRFEAARRLDALVLTVQEIACFAMNMESILAGNLQSFNSTATTVKQWKDST